MTSEDDQQDTQDRSGRIRTLAYELWEQADKPAGHDVEFWERAEKMLSGELAPDPSGQPPSDTLAA